MTTKEDNSNGGGGFGCLSFILTILALWALLFGVSAGGKHHQIQCSCDKGVEFTHD